MVSHMLFPRKACNTVSLPRWASLHVLLVLILSANTVYSGSIFKYLPGFDGELPFKLETGYISVGDSELFYYFIESQGNPQQDPLFLWLTGGPGCSSFCGLVYEIGPLEFQINNYTGGLPRLVYYPYAWTKTASIIFLDAPVGTGFSYARTPEGWPTSDSESSEQSYQFLRKWLDEHPQYLPVQLFIGGDSYSGIIVPLVTKKVIDGITAKVKPRMNLKGYLIGSPRTDSELKTSCQENYVDVDPSNTACVLALAYYKKCIKDLWSNNILEPKCAPASPSLNTELDRRSVQENSADFILSPPRIHEYRCWNFVYALAYIWCNTSLSYTKDILSVVDVHRYLSKKGLQVLVDRFSHFNNGDRDMVVPFVGTKQWIKSLNLTIVNDWRPWLVDGQIAGYTRKYSENGFRLTFATGAGHVAPEYNRRECYDMFQRWVHYYPL
ncbi:hypothetical protein ACJW31_01G357900 [Castanea mollissima]